MLGCGVGIAVGRDVEGVLVGSFDGLKLGLYEGMFVEGVNVGEAVGVDVVGRYVGDGVGFDVPKR